jgi:NAD(P)H-dependent FMN reductase
MMKTQIISGSHRADSQSMRVARYIQSRIQGMGGLAEITDLSHNALPLWDEGMWSGDAKWASLWNPIAEKLKAADSLIVISPEYAGMAAPALKNFFLFCGGDLVSHKPALLVSVTSSLTNGSYPVSELRASGYKNSHLLYLPENLIIREVEKVFHGDSPASVNDEYLRQRLDYDLKLLSEYEKALKPIRTSGMIQHETYPFGM